ncbi:MAG: signal peptidase I [Kofleriaceae bacterium]|nr:signal peptidase I [Kofleriaceae bacterium]
MVNSIEENIPAHPRRAVGLLATLVLGPGTGHLWRGQYKRALGWLALAFALLLFSAYSPIAMWTGFLGTRIGSALDYWRTSSCSIRRPLPTIGTAVGASVGFILLTVGFTQVLKSHLVQAFKIPSAAMIPALSIGDHIIVNKLDVAPERGKVVVFVYPCDENKDFVKRIIAVENDTVEQRCGRLYINGEELIHEGGERYSYWDTSHRGDAMQEHAALYSEGDYNIIYNTDYSSAEYSIHDFPSGERPSCRNSVYGPSDNPAPLGTLIENQNPDDDPCSQIRSYKVPKGHFFVMGDNRANSSDSRVWGAIPNDAIIGSYAYTWWTDPIGE